MKTAYGVVTKGNGDAFATYERHTSLSLGGGQAGQGYPCVLILNPSDSQGNQVADYRGIYPTLRGCGGAGYQQGYVLAPREQDEDLRVRQLQSSDIIRSSKPSSSE